MRPRNSPPSPAFGLIYEGAVVSKDRRQTQFSQKQAKNACFLWLKTSAWACFHENWVYINSGTVHCNWSEPSSSAVIGQFLLQPHCNWPEPSYGAQSLHMHSFIGQFLLQIRYRLSRIFLRCIVTAWSEPSPGTPDLHLNLTVFLIGREMKSALCYWSGPERPKPRGVWGAGTTWTGRMEKNQGRNSDKYVGHFVYIFFYLSNILRKYESRRYVELDCLQCKGVVKKLIQRLYTENVNI